MNSKSIICITILLSCLSFTFSQDINISVQDLVIYNRWKQSNKRSFLNEEEQVFRQLVFFENLKTINKHNSNPKSTYTAGINQFSDMTEEEFESKILNNKIFEEQGFQSSSHQEVKFSSSFQQAPSVDWRTKGAVSQVKNQGSCGSCWTFSSIALMESINFIKYGKTTDLSEQQLVDCVIQSNGFNSFGCNGGSPPEALNYAIKYGIVEEKQYPYIAKQGECKIKSVTNGFKPKTAVRLGRTVDDLKNALNSSPVAVVVSAAKWGIYKSGIFNDCETKLNHGVLAVGYDAEGNWIIKNSWGTGWGEGGYMRISAKNNCGILINNFIVTV